MDLLIWLTWELSGKTHKSIGGGGGGGLSKNVSQILAIINFSAETLPENLVSKEEYYRQHNFKPNKSFKLEQIWRRQLHQFLISDRHHSHKL